MMLLGTVVEVGITPTVVVVDTPPPPPPPGISVVGRVGEEDVVTYKVDDVVVYVLELEVGVVVEVIDVDVVTEVVDVTEVEVVTDVVEYWVVVVGRIVVVGGGG